MKRFVACFFFLVGFPLLFAGGVFGCEYELWKLRPDLFPTGYDPVTQLLSGRIRPLFAGVAFVLLGCGLYDIVDMFGGISDYREGMRGYLPKHDPMGFLVLRARRYVLAFVVAAAAFVYFYFSDSMKYARDGQSGGGRPHFYLAGVALLLARRKLNSVPVTALLIGWVTAVTTLAGMLDGASGQTPPPQRDNKRR